MKQTNRIFFIVLAILLPLLCGGSVFFLTRNVPAACIVLGLSALQDRKSTRLNSSHSRRSRMPSSA